MRPGTPFTRRYIILLRVFVHLLLTDYTLRTVIIIMYNVRYCYRRPFRGVQYALAHTYTYSCSILFKPKRRDRLWKFNETSEKNVKEALGKSSLGAQCIVRMSCWEFCRSGGIMQGFGSHGRARDRYILICYTAIATGEYCDILSTHPISYHTLYIVNDFFFFIHLKWTSSSAH